jgi:hypothetical protein
MSTGGTVLCHQSLRILNGKGDSSFASPTLQMDTVAVDKLVARPTALPFNRPTTSSPSKVPTVNTHFCGITWDDHIQNYARSTPCPRGDECPLGEQCFATSPCAILNGEGDSSFASPTLQTDMVADGLVAQTTATVVERNLAPTKLTTYQPPHALPPLTVRVPAPF